MDKTSNKYFILLIYVVLTLAVIIAYEQVRHNEFVYDDSDYVTQNPYVNGGITRESVIWAFTTPHTGNWHPLTWLSLMLDCELFGLKSLACHITNVLFHIANTLLLFVVLRRMTGAAWPSAFVAALFALHPLHVESVAWVAERKDVLSSFFWILTMAAYIRYVERPGIGRYLPVVLFLGLGLMAKPMLVTLPFVLLLLDYWPLGRFQWGNQSQAEALSQSESMRVRCQRTPLLRLICEKIPLFILVAVSSAITYIVQQSIGAMKTGERFSLIVRISNALVSYLGYIVKMVYPRRLAVLYLHPGDSLPAWKPIVCFVILAGISAVIIYAARRRRYLAVGWLWYLGTLVPVMGLVQVGVQAMADRYTYLPLVGLFIMAAWGGAELVARWHYGRIGLGISAGLLLIVLLICTRVQVKYWQNNLTLYGHALEVTENNCVMHNNYGTELLDKGRANKAMAHFKEALRINPRYLMARYNIGYVLLNSGRVDEAIASFTEMLRDKRDWEGWPDMYNNLGFAYYQKGRLDLAAQSYNEALRLKPAHVRAMNNLGLVLKKQGRIEAAISKWKKALQIEPDYPSSHYNIASALAQQGKDNEAIRHFKEVLRLRPDSAGALNRLARILATTVDTNFQNPSEALRLAEKACKLTDYKQPELLDTLAITYAATGRFPQAVETAEKAVQLATSLGKKELAQKIRERIKQYKNRQPYREPSPKVSSD